MNEKRISRFFQFAKQEAKKSDFIRCPLGAVFVYRGTVLATGHNSTKTNPLQLYLNRERDFDSPVEEVRNTLHAEVATLLKVKNLDIDFSKSSLFIYREYKSGKRAMARPCAGCMKMIKDLGIKHIYYTTEEGYAYERISAYI